MVERMVRDLAIEEALQEIIKDTLERNNQSYVEWCAQTDKNCYIRHGLAEDIIWEEI